jgi:hypothetical protein
VLVRRAEQSLDRDEQLRLFEEVAEWAGRQSRWMRAVDAHRRSSEIAAGRERRARHLYEAGIIYRDELASFDEALACFARALEGYADDGVEPPTEIAEAHQHLVQRNRSRAQR